MNRLRKIFDKALFAPTRYIEENGAGVDSTALTRIAHLPEYRMTAIYGLGASLTAFAAGASPHDRVNRGLCRIGNRMLFFGSRHFGRRLQRKTEIFLDTKPDRPLPLPGPEIQLYLERSKKNAGKLIHSVLGVCAANIAFISAVAHNTESTDDQTGKTLVCILAPITAYMIAGACGYWWRADQALAGNWNVLTAKPDPKPKVSTPHTTLAPSPL